MTSYCKTFRRTCKHFSAFFYEKTKDAASCAKSYFCCGFAPYAKFLLSYYFYISLLKAFFELTIQKFVYFIHLIVGPVGPSLTFLVLTMTFSFFLFLVSRGLTTFVKTDEQLQSILVFITSNLTIPFLGSINHLAATVLHFYEICFLYFSRNQHSLPICLHFSSFSSFCPFCPFCPQLKSKGQLKSKRQLKICSFFADFYYHKSICCGKGRKSAGQSKGSKDSQAVVKISQKLAALMQTASTLRVEIIYAFIIIAMFFLVQITLVSPASAMENPFETPEGKQTQLEASLNEKAVANDNDSAFRNAESLELFSEAQKQSFGEEVDGSKRKFSEEDASKDRETSLIVKKAKEKEYRMAKMAKLNNYSPVDIQLRALVREARKSVGLNPTRLENNASKIYEDTLRKAKSALETGSSQLESRSAAETNRRLIAYAKEVGTGRNTFLNAMRRERMAKIDEVEAFTAEQVLAHHEKNLKTLLTLEEFKNPAGFSSRYGESHMFKQLQAYVEKKPDQFDLMPDSYFSIQPKNDLILPIVGQPLTGVVGSSSACASGIDKDLANSAVATAFDLNPANPQSTLPLNEHMPVKGDFSESDAATMAAHFFDLPQ